MGCSYSSPLTKKILKYRSLTSGVGVGGCKGGKDDVVLLCRERKRLVKKAVKQRQAFADAHCKYFESLSAVAASIAVFLSQYSSSSSTSNLFIAFGSSDSTAILQSNSISRIPGNLGENEVEEEERENGVCEYFYDAVEEECKWDFFNVDLVHEKKKVEEKREVKEELKEGKQGNEKVNGNGREIKEELKEGKQGNRRELLEALKNLEEYFLKAFDSGKEVSKMLEVSTISSYSTFQDIKENAGRKRSISSRSSSCKSFLSSSSRSTSSTRAGSGGDRKSLLSCSSDTSMTVKENRCDLVSRCGMVSGSHSFTLGRLYAWEKKLYHEVKAGLQTHKIYKKKCSQLQQKDVEGDDDLCPSKASSEVTGLSHLMLVALQRAESISNQIGKLRDEELQPQLFELLHGLTRTWKSMSETHEFQGKIMREINSYSYPVDRKFSIDSHCLAAHQLEAVIQDWQSSFSDYVSTQKAYVKSLLGWLSKFIDAESEYHYASRFSLPPMRFNGPPLIVTCKSWSTSLERLPDKSVKYAMKSLGKDLQALWVQQGLEQQQKRKVDGLEKELGRMIRTLGKTEDKALVAKYTTLQKVEEQTESLGEKEQLEMFKQKVETEKERYHSSMQETKRVTMNSIQMGFSSVFESLADFSRASAKVYADLVTYSHNANGLKRVQTCR